MIKSFKQFTEKVNESEVIDISDESTFPKKSQKNNEYFVIHHTAGLGDAHDVVDVLNARKLSVQWIVDTEGKIHRSLPPNSIAYHAGGADLVPKVTNSNSQGVEVIGKDDADIKKRFDSDIEKYGYPRQAEAVRKIIKYLGYSKENIFGHGEITTNKQATEGATIKNYVLSNWDKPADLSIFQGPDQKAGGSPGTDSSTEATIIDSDLISRLIAKLKEKGFSQKDLEKFTKSGPNTTGASPVTSEPAKTGTGKGTKHIVIGDSQTPFIANKSQKFDLLGSSGSEENLWKGGMGISWLIDALKNYPVNPDIATAAICIGTNGGINRDPSKSDIKGLVDLLKQKMPNARLVAIPGSWGWGGNSKVTQDMVTRFYDEFKKLGVEVTKNSIGETDNPHSGGLASYSQIGSELDSLVSASSE